MRAVISRSRQLVRVEERVAVEPRGVAGIDVKPELALAERADRLAVDLDVADQKHLARSARGLGIVPYNLPRPAISLPSGK
jgi:hypothetical protein